MQMRTDMSLLQTLLYLKASRRKTNQRKKKKKKKKITIVSKSHMVEQLDCRLLAMLKGCFDTFFVKISVK